MEASVADLDLNAIKGRLAAATPGPFVLFDCEGRCAVLLAGRDGHFAEDMAKADALLIAHAPEDLAWCVAEIERLRAGFAALHANRDRLAAENQALRTHHGTALEVERLRAERVELLLLAEASVADALVRSKERAHRVLWIDHVTGDAHESGVDCPAEMVSAENAVCSFFRMVGEWSARREVDRLRVENAGLRGLLPTEDERDAVRHCTYLDDRRSPADRREIERVSAWLRRVEYGGTDGDA